MSRPKAFCFRRFARVLNPGLLSKLPCPPVLLEQRPARIGEPDGTTPVKAEQSGVSDG